MEGNFPALSFARPMNTYVAPPIGTLKEVLATKQQEFFVNRDLADKLEIALQNIEVDEVNQPYKQQAVDRIQGLFSTIKANGSWENAGLLVRDAAKSFATDQALNAAVADRQKAKQAETELDGLVKNGTILQSDKDFVLAEAKAKYTGIKDNGDGTYKGTYGYVTPPKYINVGEYVDKFLKDFKPDQLLGQFIKKDDGWYKTTGTNVTSGGYEYQISTERATYEELYQAAREYVLQDPAVMDRIGFEASKNKMSFKDLEAGDADKARASIIEDLNKLAGHDKAKLETYSNDDLMEIYKRESALHASISAPVAKHGYVKETIDTFGMTWQAKLELEKAKKVAEKTGGEATAESLRTILQNNYITIQNPFGHPTSLGEHALAKSQKGNAIVALQRDISTTSLDIEKAKAELAGQGVSDIEGHPKIQNLRRQYDDLVFERQSLEFEIEEADKRYEAAKEVAIASGKIKAEDIVSVEKLQSQYKDVIYRVSFKMIEKEVERFKEKNGREPSESDMEQITAKWGIAKLSNPAGEGGNPYSPGEPSAFEFFDAQKQKEIKKVVGSDWDKYNEYANKFKSGSAAKIANAIEKEMATAANSIAVETSYFNIGLGNGDKKSEWGNKSRFATQVEHDFMNNKNGWILIDSKGKRLYDDRARDKRNDYVEKIDVVGMTTESIGNHGYLVAAKTTRRDTKNPKLVIEDFVYMIPGSGVNQSGILELAKLELLDGNPKLIGGSGQSSAKTAIDLARKLDKNVIDRHMAQFNDHAITPNSKITKKVPLGYDGKFAEITRVVGNHVGTIEYRTVIKNENGSTDVASMAGQAYLSHLDKFSLEGDLEHFTGTLFAGLDKNLRAVRHNNPAAFTTKIAEQAGLVEGKDYVKGDPFEDSKGGTLYTARLIGDSTNTTVKIIDKIGFYTKEGNKRWGYVTDEQAKQWPSMSLAEKQAFVAKYMLQNETGVKR